MQSINAANLAYSVTDAQGQIILDGAATGVEDFDNFTTGDQLWTNIDNQYISPISVYPSPAKDQLYLEGEYDYLRVFDLLGKEVLYSTYVKSINVNNLNDGIYLLEITHTKNKYYQKIEISK